MKFRFLRYLVDMIPARPVASIRYVNVVLPMMDLQDASGEMMGEAGEDRDEDGVCVQVTDIGLAGSASEKEIDVTLVCS